MLKYLFSLVFLFSVSSSAVEFRGEAQVERFEIWIQDLKSSMTLSTDVEVVVEQLVKSEARNATFHIQGLARLYQHQDVKFNTLWADVKELEDGIGEYDKWKTLDATKGKQAKKDLFRLLAKRGWSQNGQSPKLDAISAELRAYNWDNYPGDRAYVLERLKVHLDLLVRTDYDVTRLELEDGDGNGLHELRREVRWFLIEAKALNGMIAYDASPTCSVSEYTELLESRWGTHKYAKFIRGAHEVDPCFVEKCLILGLVKSVDGLGNLKDGAEEDKVSREADRVPPDLVPAALGLYREMKETRVFSRLSENVGRCQR